MIRAVDAELLDAEGVSDQTLTRAYQELSMVNRWLGNTAAVLRLLQHSPYDEPIRRVLDIGCGQGALLLEIRNKLRVEVVGIDLRPSPLEADLEADVAILTGNAVCDPLPRATVAVCVLMAHHLTEVELTALIGNVALSCDRLIVLDLVRHPVPLMLFRIFVRPFLCRINAEDGQTSIRRAYTAAEMRTIVDRALAGVPRPVMQMRHTVAPFWIRQIVDICWQT